MHSLPWINLFILLPGAHVLADLHILPLNVLIIVQDILYFISLLTFSAFVLFHFWTLLQFFIVILFPAKFMQLGRCCYFSSVLCLLILLLLGCIVNEASTWMYFQAGINAEWFEWMKKPPNPHPFQLLVYHGNSCAGARKKIIKETKKKDAKLEERLCEEVPQYLHL